MNRSLASIEAAGHRAGRGIAALRDAFLTFQVGRFIGESLDYAASLGEVSQQLGVTTKDLQVYRAIGTQVGVSQEEMEKGLSKLTVSLGQAALGASKPAKAFDALGISVRNSNGDVKTAGEAIPQIADALSKVQDPAQRAAAEVALFGKAGQKLDTVLTEGSKGIEEYAKRAEDMGMVLSDEVISKADEAADRVAELNAQFRVNFSRVVAENADAILGLANALSKLTIGAIQFINQWPRLSSALAGAAAGALLTRSPYGAAAGGIAGFAAGENLARTQDDQNMNLGYRQRRLQEALAVQRRRMTEKGGDGLLTVRRGNAVGGGLTGATAEVRRQTALLRQATAQARTPAAPPVLPGVDLPEFLGKGGGGGKTRTPKAPKDNTAENLLRFQQDLARLDEELLRAKADNFSDVSMRAELERQQLTIERGAVEKAIAADVTEKKLTQAQADQLLEKDAQVRAQRMLTISTEELETRTREMLDVQMAANDNERDILQAQGSLATTAAERRIVALKLLDMDKDEEKLRLQHIIDMARLGRATAAEAQAAEARLGKLDAIYGGRRQDAMRDTESPLDRYIRETNKTGAEMNEALQGVAVNGLEAFSDGLVDAIVNFRSLGDVARSVIQQILSDLLRLQIQKAMAGIASSILGGLGGGGSLASSAASTIAANPAIFAMGGPVKGPGTSTSDSILARLSNGEFVMNAAAVRRIGVGNLSALNEGRHPRFATGGMVGKAPSFAARNDNLPPISITINGKMTEREARETGAQAYRAFRREHASMTRIAG